MNSDEVTEKLSSRGYSLDLQFISDNSNLRKSLIQQKEDLASEKNNISNSFESISSDAEKAIIVGKSRDIEEKILKLKESLYEVEQKLNNYLLEIPNIPHQSCPVGISNQENKLGKNAYQVPQWNNKNNISTYVVRSR